jgi:hypothetical protein
MRLQAIIQQIDSEIQKLQTAKAALSGSSTQSTSTPSVAAGTGKGGPRRMSADARKRIADAQRARWARQKGTEAASPSSAATAKRGPRRLNAAARARIAAAQKARWAKFKAAQRKKAA